jgi:hypothetical protein
VVAGLGQWNSIISRADKPELHAGVHACETSF